MTERPISGILVDGILLEIKPMKIDLTDYIRMLVDKAATDKSGTPDSALKYSQAALNVSHAMATINAIKEA